MKMRGENRPRGYWPLDEPRRENPPKPVRPFVVQLWHGDQEYGYWDRGSDGRLKMIAHWEIQASDENGAIAVISQNHRDEILALIPQFGREMAVGNAKFIVDRKEDFKG